MVSQPAVSSSASIVFTSSLGSCAPVNNSRIVFLIYGTAVCKLCFDVGGIQVESKHLRRSCFLVQLFYFIPLVEVNIVCLSYVEESTLGISGHTPVSGQAVYLIVIGVLEVFSFCSIVEPVTYFGIRIYQVQKLKCFVRVLASE